MTLTLKLKLRPAIVAFMLMACTTYGGAARAASPSDTHPESAQTGSGNMQMQVFLQRRFRLPSASDVEVGPPRPAPIPGMTIASRKDA